jgi:acetyltransferase-like isoleucine patch superfamily enzyme
MTDIASVQNRAWSPGARLLSCGLAVRVSRPWPGAMGRAMRRFIYARRLDACGRNVVFGRNVVLRHPDRIRIGDDVVIDDDCVLDAGHEANAGIAIGAGASLGRHTVLACVGGDIELGAASNLGFHCEVRSASRVRIGADTLFGARCSVLAGGSDDGRTASHGLGPDWPARGVGIGAGVWMGPGAKVMSGVSVGAGAMIAAGAVVCRDVPDRGVALGSPARMVGVRETRG